jgi:membrane-associated phospholipid phosphatase
MWSRVQTAWRALLVAYPLAMQFSLTYAGEHYVVDGLAGALCAYLIHWGATRVERRYAARRRRVSAVETIAGGSCRVPRETPAGGTT